MGSHFGKRAPRTSGGTIRRIVISLIAYQHYIPLLIPAGLAIVALQRRGVERLAVKSVFFMLGYALSIVYFAGIPLLALCAAVGILFFRSGGRELYAALSNEQFSRIRCWRWHCGACSFLALYRIISRILGHQQAGVYGDRGRVRTGIAAIWVFLWKAGGSMPMRFFSPLPVAAFWGGRCQYLDGKRPVGSVFDPKAWDSVGVLEFRFLDPAMAVGLMFLSHRFSPA